MPITINTETDQLFLAIGKEHQHTFLMFGVYDHNTVSHLLCRVGKNIDVDDDPNSNDCMIIINRLMNVLFSTVKSRLKNERVVRNKLGNIPISYQAYDITLEQYMEFIQLLEALQTEKNLFSCFKPTKVTEKNIVFVKTSRKICISRTNVDYLKTDANEFAYDKTCRHTAINLAREVQKVPLSSMVSSSYYKGLPYKTQLVFGKPSDQLPFYVLPISPAAYPESSAEKRAVLEKLYRRMEHLLLTDPESINTVNKFNSLKGLYTQIAGPQKNLSLKELLVSIQSWKQKDQATLSVLRQRFFWDSFIKRTSATMQTFNEIEHDLQRAQVTLG